MLLLVRLILLLCVLILCGCAGMPAGSPAHASSTEPLATNDYITFMNLTTPTSVGQFPQATGTFTLAQLAMPEGTGTLQSIVPETSLGSDSLNLQVLRPGTFVLAWI